MTAVLGLSADYHDAAAALVVDGEIVAAAEEERFTRVKHDPSLPRQAARWCLDHASLDAADIDTVAFYDKPLTTWERIVSTHGRVGPRGFPTFHDALGRWMGSKLWVGYRIDALVRELGGGSPRVVYAEHHQSHAAAAFYPSPFERAAIVTLDGVGEWATSTIGWGAGHRIEARRTQRFPDSLGLLYSAMTAFCGFAVNDGEYKLMGLAPYGEPRYAEVLRDRVVHVHDDGSVRLDQRWFDYRAGRRMTHPRLDALLDGPPAPLGADPGPREADIAASVQQVLEEAVLRTARHAHDLTGERALCLAGGVALNCVANARLLADGPFDEVWVQPAAGDSGSAVGAALWSWHQLDDNPRTARSATDAMGGAALGPGFAGDEIAGWLTFEGIAHRRLPDPDALCAEVAARLDAGDLVGWFRGRMELGPRALGHRSILGDPRRPEVARRLNAQVKRREGFRPFAPAVLAERADEWFDLRQASPYMLFTATVSERHRTPVTGPEPEAFADRLAVRRSAIPACTHVDGSARVQTVDRDRAPDLHRLIAAFADRTDVPVVVNTSFNAAGEPIVRTPADALRCARATGLDLLVLEDCVVEADALAAEVAP